MRGEFFILFLAIVLALLAYPVSAEGYSLNPYFARYFGNPQMPAPVGIASYGLYPTGNGFSHYTIETDKIVANATVNALQAHDISSQNLPFARNSMCITGQEYEPSNADMQNGANLQFNVMMQVNTTVGSQTIWLQDTARFNTAQMTMIIPHDIVANLTSGGGENIAYGNGIVNPSQHGIEYYEYEGTCYKYLLPLTISYEIDVHKISGSLVQVIFKNDDSVFDTVNLPIPNVKSAHIVVTPNQHGIPYDAEFVWVGYCCSQESTFTQMNSTLSMYYEGDGNKLHSFPTLFTFGTNTAETASNLLVKRDGHDWHVVIGQNNNTFFEQRKNSTSTTHGSMTIPSWIKNNTKLWSQGEITDTGFVKGMQYLIQNKIIQISTTQPSSGTTQQIPAWVKNDAEWWADGQISDGEFVKAVQYLINNDVIQISS
ncbi:MAG: thermopsin family protease [Nitrosotalea sp.]